MAVNSYITITNTGKCTALCLLCNKIEYSDTGDDKVKIGLMRVVLATASSHIAEIILGTTAVILISRRLRG